MQAAIGNEAVPELEGLDQYKEVHRGVFDDEIDILPIRKYMTCYCYNLRIKVRAGENQLELFHQAFCKWYLKIRKADTQAMVYPWAEVCDDKDLLIENPMDIPMALPLLKDICSQTFPQDNRRSIPHTSAVGN